ncbi:MAG TPA: ATPase, T2SS/T4P/T4SS family [Micromonosporaceae bacterium]
MTDQDTTPHNGTPWAPPRINGFRHLTADRSDQDRPALTAGPAGAGAPDDTDAGGAHSAGAYANGSHAGTSPTGATHAQDSRPDRPYAVEPYAVEPYAAEPYADGPYADELRAIAAWSSAADTNPAHTKAADTNAAQTNPAQTNDAGRSGSAHPGRERWGARSPGAPGSGDAWSAGGPAGTAPTDWSRVNGGAARVGQPIPDQANGGHVNDGQVHGGQVNGDQVNGGQVNGVNGQRAASGVRAWVDISAHAPHIAAGPASDGAGAGGSPYPVDRLAPQVHTGWDAPRTAPTADPAVQIDYELVTALQNEVSRQLIDALRGEVGLTNADRRRMTEEFAERVVAQNVDSRLRAGETGPVMWPGYTQALRSAVSAFLIGLGRLQPLIDNPDVENIMVLGTRVRVVYANGAIDEDSFTAAASDEELIALLQRLAERGGQTERSLSTAKPILHLRLPDGARLTVIYVVTARPVVVIRRHRVKDVSLADMVTMGAITPTLKSFLEAAVRAHMNIMIAGRANAGKTTLLRAIADEIPREEWFCVMETVGELGLDQTGRHPWAVCFEEREGFGEKGPDGQPEGQLTIDDLFPHMLRLSANRIIVGEVRAQEIVAMFDAMNTTYGSLCTIHSRDEHGVFDRLAELLLRYGASKNREGAYLTVGNALDLVVYVNMDEAPGYRPRRYVSSVIEVHGLGEGRQLSRSRIFAPGPHGLAVPTSVRLSERRSAELQAAGFDMRALLTPQIGSYLPGGGR